MMYTSTLLNPQLRLTEMQSQAPPPQPITSQTNAESKRQEEEPEISSKEIELVKDIVNAINPSAKGNTQSILQKEEIPSSSKNMVEIVEQIVHTTESEEAVNQLLGAEVIGEMEYISM